MKNELIFKIYTKEEIDNLLSTPISKKIKSIKVKKWFNAKTLGVYYGLDVVAESGTICGLCEGNRAVIFKDKKIANSVCKKMLERLNKRTCRVCGCTDDNCSQCIEKTGHPCHWVEEDLCSACVVQTPEEVLREKTNAEKFRSLISDCHHLN